MMASWLDEPRYVVRQKTRLRERYYAGQCCHGLCPEPVVRAGRCAKHRARLLQLQRTRHAALRAAGICVRCREAPARAGFASCLDCAQIGALKERERKATRQKRSATSDCRPSGAGKRNEKVGES